MAFTVQFNFTDRFKAGATDGNGGIYVVAPGAAFPDSSLSLASGTIQNQINKEYVATYAITNGGTTSVDLTTCTYGGTTQTFTAVKVLKVSLATTTTADTNPQVTFGPMGVANGAILCFAGTTGSQDVRQTYFNTNAVSGWSVTASNKVIQFSNGGSYPINCSVMVLGTG